MAVLSGVTELSRVRVPDGQYEMVTYEVTGAGNAAADEWIVVGDEVIAVVGYATIGTDDLGLNFVLNAEGTGETEGTTRGALGIEASGGSGVFHVTVVAR